MAALKDIKRKITAVQKTRQITRAMNMVAASKFKAAQTRMENFRPYAAKFLEVLNNLAPRVDAESHPLLAVREPKRIRVICMTSDRGLCGGFNTNLIKATERFVNEKLREGREVSLIPVGRKGRDYFRKKATLINGRADVFGRFDMTLAGEIAGRHPLVAGVRRAVCPLRVCQRSHPPTDRGPAFPPSLHRAGSSARTAKRPRHNLRTFG
jgi:F-type H+-transporting ATPase subunit gamma